MSIRQHLLASTLFSAVALVAVPAFAQNAPASDDAGTEVGEVVVTGTRIPKNEFNSANPIQVLSADRALATGVSDTVQFLQNSTIAAGSPQVNPIISTAFVTDGGPGAATISLRGLGANRTLVLLNGRRAGPAGTRGSVSSFDLNVLPQSAIDHIDILKDGASSIYGSDAIAGVVNIITKKNRNGGELAAFYSDPFDTGGEEMDFSGTYGRSGDRWRFTVSADYYKQNELQNGERSYTQCAEQYIFNPATGKRSDDIDPRTGKYHCNDVDEGHVWIYGYSPSQGFFTTRSGRFQFSGADNLGQFIPTRPGLPGNGVCTTPRNLDADCYPGAPAGMYVVGYDAASRAVTNANSPLEDAASLIPETQRSTFYGDGSYDLTDHVQLYTELLYNRRVTRTHGFRQYWTYNFTSTPNPSAGGLSDPLSVGWTGNFVLSPTPGTDWFGSTTRVDYTRGIFGVKGDYSLGFLKDWTWDLYGQASRSLGAYEQQVILQDAIDASTGIGLTETSTRNGSCVGQTLPVSGRPCIDINFTDPRVLAGNLTQAEKDFLFDTDIGKTTYDQQFVEGTTAGNLFDLPAGPVGAAIGFHLQRDKINDVPGAITREGNSWGLSSAGITSGKQTMNEVFTEVSVPLLKEMPFVQSLGLTLSGRYTDVDTAGDKTTYKVGLNWQMTPMFKVRATHGTSFRAPALFELFLADQTDFQSQRALDPCINWGSNLALNLISQRVADNCANPNGPGGGVAPDHPAGGSSAEIVTSGGLGELRPETSVASVFGIVFTPKFINLSVAVDYFDIHVKDEVTTLGANIPAVCYNSLNFPNDPVCDLFVRNSGTQRIDLVQDKYINISDQRNRGIDVTVQYRHDLPWDTKLTVDGDFTWRLQDTIALFEGSEIDRNHRLGYPQFTGNVDATFIKGPWQFLWGAQLIGEQSSMGDYGSDTVTINGVVHNVKAWADFQAYHHASIKYDFKDASIMVGVSNIFDTAPPQVTTVSSGLGLYNTVGTSLLNSQYTEGFLGRRGFVRVSKKF